MRRILAIILAVAMIATLAPSAFATETSGEGDVNIKLNIESLLNGYTTTTPLAAIMSYTTTNNIFRYLRSSLTASTQALDLAGTETPVASQVEFAGVADSRFMRITGRRYVCFEIDIPSTGAYSMSVHHQRSTRGVKADVYLMDYASYNAIGTFGIAKLGNPVGQYDCDNDESEYTDFNGSNKEWVDSVIFTDKELSEGKYIITFIPPTGISNSDRYTIGNITLTGDTFSEAELGFSVNYNIDKTMFDNGVYYGTAYTARDLDYNMTNGFFNVYGVSGSVSLGGNAATTYRFIKVKSDAAVAIKVNVPQGGLYSLVTSYQKSKDGGLATVEVDGNVVGTYNCSDTTLTYNMGGNGAVWENDAVIAENLNLTAGEHIVRISVGGSNKYASVYDFALVSGAGKLATKMGGYIKVGKTSLVPREETTASVVACLSDGSIDTDAEISALGSSDTSVITVAGNKVIAVGVGTANIEATVDGNTVSQEITVADIEAPAKVSLAVSNNIDDSIEIQNVNRGSSVTATAPEKEGYKFRHWVRGTEDNGEWISGDAEYKFNLITNTYLTAIYTPVAEDEKIVEFWNGNGQYITEEKVVDGSVSLPENPKLTGFVFSRWLIAEDTEFVNANITAPLTRAVADFASLGKTITVEGTMCEYDEAITKNSASGNEVAWYRDGVLVGYGKSYTYHAWSDVGSVAEAAITVKAPVVVLDAAARGSARMIEFDAGDMNIVEVGILFGDTSAKPTVDSCKYKATSAKNGVGIHGQFTAQPADSTYTNARGYLIYKDSKNTYRVIYAD